MSDLIRRMDAIQACAVGPSDEWSRSTRSGYAQAATDCSMNILRIESEPPNPLAVLAMRERAAAWMDSQALNDDELRQGYCFTPAYPAVAASSIRALPTTFTDAELLAAAMKLPEVRALVDVANAMKPQLERRSYESLNMYTGKTERHFGVSGETWSVFCAALAPFKKGGE